MTGAERLEIDPNYRVKFFAKLDSTSDEAKRQAKAGESAGLWILADEQSKGRGRRGREWQSEKGNLFASLLLFPACDVSKNTELSFVAAVAVASTLRHFGASDITCKWPNDVLIGGKKVAGILLETESTGNPQKPWVIIGIGINVTAFPRNADYPATALNNEIVIPTSRDQVFEELTYKFSDCVTKWAEFGFKPIKTLWLNQAHGKGKMIRVDTGNEVVTGRMMGIADNGAMIIEDEGRKFVEIISGTVLKDV